MEKIKLTIKKPPVVNCKIDERITVLPNDYSLIGNKPTINGTEINGSLSSEDLSILSSVATDYQELSLGEIDEESIVMVGGEKPVRIQMKELLSVISLIDSGKVMEVNADGAVITELAPNLFYDFTGALTSLTITFSSLVPNRENEYKGQFRTNSVIPPVLFPDDIVWLGGEFPEIEENKIYQFSVLNNVGVMVGV